MGVKAERLKGYLLEEALVYLLRNAGFRLPADERRDAAALGWRRERRKKAGRAGGDAGAGGYGRPGMRRVVRGDG